MVIEQIGFDTKMKQLQADIRDLLQQEEESKQELKAIFEMLEYTLWFFPVLSNISNIGKNVVLYKVKNTGMFLSNSFQSLQDWKESVIFVSK